MSSSVAPVTTAAPAPALNPKTPRNHSSGQKPATLEGSDVLTIEPQTSRPIAALPLPTPFTASVTSGGGQGPPLSADTRSTSSAHRAPHGVSSSQDVAPSARTNEVSSNGVIREKEKTDSSALLPLPVSPVDASPATSHRGGGASTRSNSSRSPGSAPPPRAHRLGTMEMSIKTSIDYGDPQSKGAVIKVPLRFENFRPWYILSPSRNQTTIWTAIILLCISQTVIFLPYEAAFGKVAASDPMAIFVSLVYVADLVFNFFLPVEDAYSHRVRSFSLEEIAKAYLNSWFIVDLIAVFPFSLMGATGVSTLVYFLQLVKLFKIRVLTKKLQIQHLVLFSLAGNIVLILRMLLIFLVFAHWCGCVFFLIGTSSDSVSWIDDVRIRDADGLTQYVTCLYWSLTTLVTVGYGDIHPESTREKVFVCFCFLAGSVIYASIFGIVTTAVQNFDERRNRNFQQLKAATEFARSHDIPPALLDKIVQYHNYFWYVTKGFDREQVMATMPTVLRDQIKWHLHSDIVKSVPMFKKCDESFIRQIVRHMSFEVVLAGDLLIRKGDQSEEMYFIENGELEVLAETNYTLAVLTDGSFFGEIGLFTGCRRTATVRARKDSTLFVLTRRQLDSILSDFPEYISMIEEKAMIRLYRTLAQEAQTMQDPFGNLDASVTENRSTSVSNDDSTTPRDSLAFASQQQGQPQTTFSPVPYSLAEDKAVSNAAASSSGGQRSSLRSSLQNVPALALGGISQNSVSGSGAVGNEPPAQAAPDSPSKPGEENGTSTLTKIQTEANADSESDSQSSHSSPPTPKEGSGKTGMDPDLREADASGIDSEAHFASPSDGVDISGHSPAPSIPEDKVSYTKITPFSSAVSEGGEEEDEGSPSPLVEGARRPSFYGALGSAIGNGEPPTSPGRRRRKASVAPLMETGSPTAQRRPSQLGTNTNSMIASFVESYFDQKNGGLTSRRNSLIGAGALGLARTEDEEVNENTPDSPSKRRGSFYEQSRRRLSHHLASPAQQQRDAGAGVIQSHRRLTRLLGSKDNNSQAQSPSASHKARDKSGASIELVFQRMDKLEGEVGAMRQILSGLREDIRRLTTILAADDAKLAVASSPTPDKK